MFAQNKPRPLTLAATRPNAFQRFLPSTPPLENVINFLGVPFDPPGAGETRILRITNIRSDAALFGGGGPHRSRR